MAGILAAGNSTDEALGASEVWTGKSDIVKDYGSITVSVYADVASATDGLVVEWSTDNVNWFATRRVTLGAGETRLLRLEVYGYRFRLSYTNGDVAQSAFRVQSIYHVFTNGRRARPPEIDYFAGVNDDGHVDVDKFGTNPDVGTGAIEDIWDVGGAYPFPQAALAVRIKAGGSADDDAAGTGAQKVIVEGLDENWDLASEEITTNGISVSNPTTTTFIRINRAYVSECGAYGGTNAANIDIETTGGTTLARIAAGLSQTRMAIYSVPRGYIAHLLGTEYNTDGAKAADFYFYQRRNGHDVTTPFSAKRVYQFFGGVLGFISTDHRHLDEFPAYTDIWVAAKATTNATAASAKFELLLIPDIL